MKHDAYIGIDPSYARSGVAYLDCRSGIASVTRVGVPFEGPGFPGSLDAADGALRRIVKALRPLRDCKSIGLAIEYAPPTGGNSGGRSRKIFNAAPLFLLDSLLTRELPRHLPITEVALMATAKCRGLADSHASGDKGKSEIREYTLGLYGRAEGIRSVYFLGTSKGDLCHDEAEALLLMLYLARRDHVWIFGRREDQRSLDVLYGKLEEKRWEWSGEPCRYPRKDWFGYQEEGHQDHEEGGEEGRQEDLQEDLQEDQ